MPDRETFVPALITTDWAEEWKALQLTRRAADEAAFWDERSKTFGCNAATPSPYAARFIELSGIRPGETALDMGCGTGALALPLGLAGHEVIAADFSSGMLARLEEACAQRGVTTVKTKLMSWEDDWDAKGVGEDAVDVAMASRSIATADMRDSLERLTRAARRRACVTLPTGASPRADERIIRAIGLQSQLGRDFLYAFMILVGMGFHPEVAYIDSARYDTYQTKAEASENLRKMVLDAARGLASDEETTRACERLDAWLDENLVRNEAAGTPDASGNPQKELRLAQPRMITWAHISWNTRA